MFLQTKVETSDAVAEKSRSSAKRWKYSAAQRRSHLASWAQVSGGGENGTGGATGKWKSGGLGCQPHRGDKNMSLRYMQLVLESRPQEAQCCSYQSTDRQRPRYQTGNPATKGQVKGQNTWTRTEVNITEQVQQVQANSTAKAP